MRYESQLDTKCGQSLIAIAFCTIVCCLLNAVLV
jgi:hypothetical protein